MNDPELEQLLHRARGIAPRAGHKDRLRSRVLASAVTGGLATLAAHAAGAGTLGAAVGKSSSPLLSVLACVGGGVVIGLVLIGPALTLPRQSPGPRAPERATVSQRSAASPAPTPRAKTSPSGSANITTSPSRPAAPSGFASVDTRVPSIERETALLGEAQGALRRNDAARALELLDAYDREFPTGTLSEEASAARTVGWCALGRRAEGLRALGRFRATYPGSPLLARVTAACHNVGGHDDFELESPSPSTQPSRRSGSASATGSDLE